MCIIIKEAYTLKKDKTVYSVFVKRDGVFESPFAHAVLRKGKQFAKKYNENEIGFHRFVSKITAIKYQEDLRTNFFPNFFRSQTGDAIIKSIIPKETEIQIGKIPMTYYGAGLPIILSPVIIQTLGEVK